MRIDLKNSTFPSSLHFVPAETKVAPRLAVISRQKVFILCLLCVAVSLLYLAYSSSDKHPQIDSYHFGQNSKAINAWRFNNSDIEAPDHTWTLVDGRNVILRTAYADLAESRRVRILAYKYCKKAEDVVCKFQSKFVDYSTNVTGHFDLINTPDDGDCLGADRYEPYFLYCSLPRLPGELALFRPTSVSVSSSDSRSVPGKPIPIHYVPKSRFQLAVCVAPMHDWDDTHQLALFIEYYVSQGADYFIIYNRSSTPPVRNLLEEYKKLGLVQIVQWPSLPKPRTAADDPNGHLHYYGQILSMNDCLWKLRTRAKYVALVDVDELIVPLESETLTVLELIQIMDQKWIGGFMFLNSYAFASFPWTDDESNETDWFKFFDFSKLTIFRDSYIYPADTRSKVIVKPEAILKQSVHLAWKYSPSYSCHVVQSSMAILYHLRPLKARVPSAKSDTKLSNRLRTLLSFNFTDGLV